MEIRSGALIPCGFLSDGTPVYWIQANTRQGLRTFENAQELLGGHPGEIGLSHFLHNLVGWTGWTTSVVFSGSVLTSPAPVSEPAEEDAEFSPAEILTLLLTADLPAVKRRAMILAAETLRFDASQAESLKPLLRRFIDRVYATEQGDEQVAVASAVRKYIALLSPAELPVVATLLRADRKGPPWFEMEVAKMVARKLTATLPENTVPLGPLGDELIDLVRGYLSPRLLPKRHCGAVAFDASLALALLASPHLGELVALLRLVRVEWFRTSLARQARAIHSDLGKRFPADRCNRACRALEELATAAEAPLA